MVGHSGIKVDNFQVHVNSMSGFHKRYMTSNKACHLWADSVRQLSVGMMVPQHGKRLEGRAIFDEFLDWISGLSCGIDLIDESTYDISELMTLARF